MDSGVGLVRILLTLNPITNIMENRMEKQLETYMELGTFIEASRDQVCFVPLTYLSLYS